MPTHDPHTHLVALSKAEAAVIRRSLTEYVDPNEETAALIDRISARLAVLETKEPPAVVVDADWENGRVRLP